ncbi:ferritin-like protein [Mesorhizobium sp. M0244]|uniref:ferritin-like domain-containing protein n=1 Tax=Mesorhizobium sp. M0244 TaxID=2956926 RepID=UPI003337E8BE
MPTPTDKQTLLTWLQTALELELATIPPYMVALLSIKLPGNRAAAEIIRSVMVEEMLHLTLIANVMNAVGGKPRIDSSAAPSYPLHMQFDGKAFADRQFPIDLAPFRATTIATFLQIELPHRPPQPELLVEKLVVPAPTIGEFYGRIEELLARLDAEGPLFTGNPAYQISEDYFWSGGGHVIPVTDFASAKAALDLVITQGEGAAMPVNAQAAKFGDALEMGHYFRFREIEAGRRFAIGDDPFGEPTGDSLAIDYEAVYPIMVSPKAADYRLGSTHAALNGDFNRRYTTMLEEIHEALNGTPKTLYTAIMDSMHSLTPIAHEMMKTPVDGDPQGRTGCPTFEWTTS